MRRARIRPVPFVIAAVAAFALWAGKAAPAQEYPNKPIRIIVPYNAGGVVDSVGRLIAAHVAESVGQPVIVENRPGASAMAGMQQCAQAPADGHTTCLALPDPLYYNPLLFKTMPYDGARAFAPVINIGFTSNLLAANIKAPFDSYKEMIAYAKANPGKINWGTWGPATLPDIYLRWLHARTGAQMTGVAYRGAAQTNPALISGEIDVMYTGFGVAGRQIDAKQVKPIVALTGARSDYMPELPTLAEQGDDPGMQSYFGLWTAAGTPKPAIDRLNREVTKAIAQANVQAAYKSFTMAFKPNTPEQFAAFMKEDGEAVARVFKRIGIEPTDAPQ